MIEVLHPHSLDRHQAYGFQRPVIVTAPISSHAAIIPKGQARYNRNVVLIVDW